MRNWAVPAAPLRLLQNWERAIGEGDNPQEGSVWRTSVTMGDEMLWRINMTMGWRVQAANKNRNTVRYI